MFGKFGSLVKNKSILNNSETKMSSLMTNNDPNQSKSTINKTSYLYKTGGFAYGQALYSKETTAGNVFASVENLNNTLNTLTLSMGSPMLKTCKSKLPLNNSSSHNNNINSSTNNNNNNNNTNEKTTTSPTTMFTNVPATVGIQLVGQVFKVGRKIGNGNFGELRLGKNINTNKNVAIKFEKSNTRTPLLQIESKFYKRLQNGEGKTDGRLKQLFFCYSIFLNISMI